MITLKECPRHRDAGFIVGMNGNARDSSIKCAHGDCISVASSNSIDARECWNNACDRLAVQIINEHTREIEFMRSQIEAINARHKEHDDGLRAMGGESKPKTSEADAATMRGECLPCPFCGGRAEVCMNDDGEWQVNCLIRTCHSLGPTGLHGNAIAAWNKAKR